MRVAAKHGQPGELNVDALHMGHGYVVMAYVLVMAYLAMAYMVK